MPLTKKKKASIPAWELSSNRSMTSYLQRLEAKDYGTFDELQGLLEQFLKNPNSLKHHKEDELDMKLKLMTHLPNNNPEKLHTISACEGSPHGQRIIDYLLDPKKVGKDR